MFRGCMLLLGLGGAGAVAYKRRQLNASQEKAACSMTLKERFESFSTAPDKSFMSIGDFIRSVTSHETNEQSASGSVIRNLFKLLDADGDNMVSYAEYCTFFSLISVPDDLFRVAFVMFDRDGNGHLDFSEFSQVMKSLRVDPEVDLDLPNSSIARRLFGPQRDRNLTYASFLDLVHKLRWELRRAEFEDFDRTSPGRITLADLRKIVFKGDEQRSKMQPKDTETIVSWNTYRKFFELLLDAEKIARAMELYHDAQASDDGEATAAGEGVVGRMEFARALRCGQVKNISPEEVDIFFRLFDADGSNSVSASEFKEMCNVRNAFYATQMPSFSEPRRSGPQQFLYCMAQRI
jgi:Ca2+-binding EF-hand superfamily protein